MIVVAASAAIRWFMPASPGGQPSGLPTTDAPLVAPDLFIAEVRNAALVYLRKKELTLDQAKDMVSTIDRLMAGLFPLAEFSDGAWAMALEHDHPVYDCFYVEVARSLDTVLITADERLLRKFAGTPLESRLVHHAAWRP